MSNMDRTTRLTKAFLRNLVVLISVGLILIFVTLQTRGKAEDEARHQTRPVPPPVTYRYRPMVWNAAKWNGAGMKGKVILALTTR